jgi:hypothetical protein
VGGDDGGMTKKSLKNMFVTDIVTGNVFVTRVARNRCSPLFFSLSLKAEQGV